MLAAIVVVLCGLLAVRALGRDSGGGDLGPESAAAGDCVPDEPATATVETYSITPTMSAVPGIDPFDIPQEVEVNGTVTNTSAVDISVGVQIPMVSGPEQVVYSDYVDLGPGESAEYTASGVFLQEELAVPLTPDSLAIVVDWTQVGDFVPTCD